jgi:hypothetical protein
MDHLLEHEGEAVPASGGSSGLTGTSSAMDVDEDEDADAAALGIGVGEGVEAKVRLRPVLAQRRRTVDRPLARNRASSVRFVARRFGIPPWRISTLRRAGTISLRKVQKRCVVRVRDVVVLIVSLSADVDVGARRSNRSRKTKSEKSSPSCAPRWLRNVRSRQRRTPRKQRKTQSSGVSRTRWVNQSPWIPRAHLVA